MELSITWQVYRKWIQPSHKLTLQRSGSEFPTSQILFLPRDYATSPDGNTWALKGEALPPGTLGTWDESGNLAPYVVPCNGWYYLFYTGFCKEDLSTRHLGYAVADTPSGPWYRSSKGPI